jgi:hypothetical protein
MAIAMAVQTRGQWPCRASTCVVPVPVPVTVLVPVPVPVPTPSMSSSDSESLTQKWLRQNVAAYNDGNRVFADVDSTLSLYPTLRPKTDVYSLVTCAQNDPSTVLLSLPFPIYSL